LKPNTVHPHALVPDHGADSGTSIPFLADRGRSGQLQIVANIGLAGSVTRGRRWSRLDHEVNASES